MQNNILDTNLSQSAIPKKRLTPIPFIILGVLLGCAAATGITGGYFTNWKRLPLPPTPAADILGMNQLQAGGVEIFVQSQDKAIYRCESLGSGCTWVRQDTRPKSQASTACVKDSDKFDETQVPFAEIKDCAELLVQGKNSPPEEVTLVLDQDGALWQWSQHSAAILCYSVPLALGGAFTGLLLAIALRGLIERTAKTSPSLSQAWHREAIERLARIWAAASAVLLAARIIFAIFDTPKNWVVIGVLLLSLAGMIIVIQRRNLGLGLILVSFLGGWLAGLALPGIMGGVSQTLEIFTWVALHFPGLLFTYLWLSTRKT